MQNKLLTDFLKSELYFSQSDRQQKTNVAVAIELEQVLTQLKQIQSFVPTCIYTQLACKNVFEAIEATKTSSSSKYSKHLRRAKPYVLQPNANSSNEELQPWQTQKFKKTRIKLLPVTNSKSTCIPQSLLLNRLYDISMLATIAGEILIASNTSESKYSFAILVITSGFFLLYSIVKKKEKKLVSLFLLFFLLDSLGFYCWILKPLFQ
jgi:hypothetical protein